MRDAMVTTETLMAAVHDLLPEIRSRSDEIEAARRLPSDLVDSLTRAGVFRMPMPASWGGPEVSLPDQLRVIELLATADPSVGWCCMIGSDAGFYSAFFPDDAAKTLWTDIDDVTAGWLFPAGRAMRTDGGYVVDGRWSFGSCCLHAQVLVGACLVVDAHGDMELDRDGQPVMVTIGARADRFEILDTWYTTGLAGSGSNDYRCSDLFVPEEHTFSILGAPLRDGPLYALRGAFFANTHGVPLGLTRRAIDEVEAIAATKTVLPQMTRMAEIPRVKEAIADAEIQLRSTRAYAYEAIEAVWAELEAGRPLSQQLRADLALSRIQAFRTAREVTLRMVQLAGTQAIYSTSVLDRLLRDAVTMGQHVVAGPLLAEAAGGLVLGAEPTGMLAGLL